jgi:hypothetical protein
MSEGQDGGGGGSNPFLRWGIYLLIIIVLNLILIPLFGIRIIPL